MKQAHLGGRTQGLRPSQQRQLDRLSHRRHPESSGADLTTLERLSDLVLELELSLHLLLDGRGLCRLLWLGQLDRSETVLSQLRGASRRRDHSCRLVSCPFSRHGLPSHSDEAVIALDLSLHHWMRFAPRRDPDGRRPTEVLLPDPTQPSGWRQVEQGDLRELCGIEVQTELTPVVLERSGPEPVLLLRLTSTNTERNDRDLAELEGLVRSAGAQPVGLVEQRQGQANPQTLWGKGKLQEAALEIRRSGAALVVTDRELTPVQARNIERMVSCPVSDRSELILDIFAQRAGSAAGRLQVELAQLRYRLPRLLGKGTALSRQGGGIGSRGPGETQLEKDRRAISRRIERLLRDQRQLQSHRTRLREQRHAQPRVALVGYTNAGKSSLLNALCGRRERDKVLAENKLFATLDPTTRRLDLPCAGGPPQRLLLTDTVGFIRELPSPLLEAFRSTLEEALDADLLLLVVDLADPDWQGQLKTVHQQLDSLGSQSLRRVVANQIDRCELSAVEAIREQEPDCLFLSAMRGDGLQGLRQWLRWQFFSNTSESRRTEGDEALEWMS